jgi:hypothetical protein
MSSTERRRLYDPDGSALGQRTIVLKDGSQIPIQVCTIVLDRFHFMAPVSS